MVAGMHFSSGGFSNLANSVLIFRILRFPLEDLRKLGQLRGGINEGERMRHLFWRLNFLLLSGATNSAQMYHEAAALSSELDTRWSYHQRYDALQQGEIL